MVRKSQTNNNQEISGVLAIGKMAKFYRRKLVPGSSVVRDAQQEPIDYMYEMWRHDLLRALDVGRDVNLAHEFLVGVKRVGRVIDRWRALSVNDI